MSEREVQLIYRAAKILFVGQTLGISLKSLGLCLRAASQWFSLSGFTHTKPNNSSPPTRSRCHQCRAGMILNCRKV